MSTTRRSGRPTAGGPTYNRRLRDVVAAMTDEQLAHPAVARALAALGDRRPRRLPAGVLAVRLRRRARRRDDAVHERRRTTARATTTSSTCSAPTRSSRRSTRPSGSSRAAWTAGPSTCSTRSSAAPSGTSLGPHPRLGHPAGLQPRRLPQRRAERGARGRGAAADRPLGLRSAVPSAGAGSPSRHRFRRRRRRDRRGPCRRAVRSSPCRAGVRSARPSGRGSPVGSTR